MRMLSFPAALLLALVMLVVACNTVDPGDCYPNTSGGFGGGGTIPIGAGVGVSSGDFASPPRFGPLGYGAPANPCVTMGSDTAGPGASARGTSTAAGGAGGAGSVVCGAGGAGVGVGADGGGGGVAGSDTVTFCDNPCASQCAGFSAAIGVFDASVFTFATTIADDGQGDAGGWQQATATLNFVRLDGTSPQSWSCTITVGMPVRAKAFGTISPTDAATLSAALATQAWRYVRKVSPGLPPGIFCSRFKLAMESLFAEPPYDKLGARVNLN